MLNSSSFQGGILSLLVIHSFGRVIKRLEREAIIQHPSTWDPIYHVEKATNGIVRPGLSSASVASNPFRGRPLADLTDNDEASNQGQNNTLRPSADVPTSLSAENPFDDFEYVDHAMLRQAERSPALSLRNDSLLPGASELHPGLQPNMKQRDSTAVLLRPMSESTTSQYSVGSSRRHSLFYLEKHQ